MASRRKPLSEQVIVITGASSGIGLATALAASDRGASVVLAARNEAALASVVETIRTAGGRAALAVADVGVEADVANIAAIAEAEFGGFDTWVNNAGVAAYCNLADLPTNEHERIFRTNYWGVVHGSLAAVRHFRARGHAGAIINIGSVNSDIAIPLLSAYSASKHAVKGFTDALRAELRHAGDPIAVTLIKPSGIATPFPEHARNHLRDEPRVIPPLYAPEIVARAILRAAEHPVPEMVVGTFGRMLLAGKTVAPGLMGQLIAAFAPGLQVSSHPRTRTDNLDAPGDDGRIYNRNSPALPFSVYDSARNNPVTVMAGVALVGAILARRQIRRAMRRF